MNLELDGKTALVTGSTAGIGFAIAQRLAREGAEVIVNGRTSERVEEAMTAIRKEISSAKLRGVAADLGNAKGCQELARQVPSVDILVNNVGIFEPKPFAEITDADWEKFFADQCDVRCTHEPRLHRGDAEEELGSHRLHFE